MSASNSDGERIKHRLFLKFIISLFSFCLVSFGVLYLVLIFNINRWEDTEMIKSLNRPAVNTLIEKEFIIHEGADYFETYQIELPQEDNSSFTKHVNDIINAERPKWFSALYRLRDTIVGPLGLKTSKKYFTTNEIVEFKVGERFRTFTITALSENEIVFGDDDKHLVLSCSISKSKHNGQNHLYFTTLVRFKNIWGALYFFAVKPIHKLMIKTRLKGYEAYISR